MFLSLLILFKNYLLYFGVKKDDYFLFYFKINPFWDVGHSVASQAHGDKHDKKSINFVCNSNINSSIKSYHNHTNCFTNWQTFDLKETFLFFGHNKSVNSNHKLVSSI